MDPTTYRFYDYTLNENGHLRHYGDARRDYQTDVLARKAVGFVDRSAERARPFFLTFSTQAPHDEEMKPPRPAPRHRGAFSDEPLPRPPSFNEQDVADKPSFLRNRPPLNEAQIAELQRQNRCRLASLPAVDEGVRRIVEAVSKAGELGETAIAFVSDNGYFFGEHRVPNEKYLAYEEAIRIPTLIRFPAGIGTPGAEIGAPVANIDIAPTLLDLAGAPPCIRAGCRVLDGRSLAGLVQGGGWPSDRALVIELVRAAERPTTLFPCTYAGLRVASQVYVEYSSVPDASGRCVPASEREHYDLAADPHQLDNLAPAPPGSPAAEAQAVLSARLAALVDCAGIEGRDPLPPSGHYCE
jgi:arylsulfatase A-like enzyme